jgi:hypothetical protein
MRMIFDIGYRGQGFSRLVHINADHALAPGRVSVEER